MAVKIRLARFGAKKKPYYRVVVADARYKRDGRYIEQVGTYDPRKEGGKVVLKEDRVRQWLDQGAQPTQTVLSILKNEGILGSKAAPEEAGETAPAGE